MKFTQADREYFQAVRKESPEVDSMFVAVRQMLEAFPGSKIVYLRVRDSEWGKPLPEGVPYVRVDQRPGTIRKGKHKQQAQQTVGQRRRATTKYKGDPS